MEKAQRYDDIGNYTMPHKSLRIASEREGTRIVSSHKEVTGSSEGDNKTSQILPLKKLL